MSECNEVDESSALPIRVALVAGGADCLFLSQTRADNARKLLHFFDFIRKTQGQIVYIADVTKKFSCFAVFRLLQNKILQSRIHDFLIYSDVTQSYNRRRMIEKLLQ